MSDINLANPGNLDQALLGKIPKHTFTMPDDVFGKDKDGNIIPGDYIFATKIKALEGRGFLEKNVKAAQKELKDRLLAAVKGAIK